MTQHLAPVAFAMAVLEQLNESEPLPMLSFEELPVLSRFPGVIVPHEVTNDPVLIVRTLQQGLEWDLEDAELDPDDVTCIWGFVGFEERTHGEQQRPTYVFQVSAWETAKS